MDKSQDNVPALYAEIQRLERENGRLAADNARYREMEVLRADICRATIAKLYGAQMDLQHAAEALDQPKPQLWIAPTSDGTA